MLASAEPRGRWRWTGSTASHTRHPHKEQVETQVERHLAKVAERRDEAPWLAVGDGRGPAEVELEGGDDLAFLR